MKREILVLILGEGLMLQICFLNSLNFFFFYYYLKKKLFWKISISFNSSPNLKRGIFYCKIKRDNEKSFIKSLKMNNQSHFSKIIKITGILSKIFFFFFLHPDPMKEGSDIDLFIFLTRKNWDDVELSSSLLIS